MLDPPAPFVGEVRMFAGSIAPSGWALCDGASLPIEANTALFQLIGTYYGGNGVTYFNLPDLRGRLPVHQGSGFVLGQVGGSETVTLTLPQIPSHGHPLTVSQNSAAGNMPTGNVTGESGGAIQIYREANPTTAMSPVAISAAGGSQSHTNIQPYLCVNFIIALQGIYPAQG